jgi:ketosteroid isomerase-like protein
VTAGALVRRLYEAYDARDWAAAAALLHEHAVVEMPATGERLAGREGVVAFQRAYPEPWGDLRVLRVVEDGAGAAAEVEVVAPDAAFRLAAFWRCADGLLREGVEYWVTPGGDEVPSTRSPAYAGDDA